jgi:hypothetical protein
VYLLQPPLTNAVHSRCQYCETVLRPEAMYQLLLWYRSERTVAAVQGDAEEKRMHERAVQLSEDFDLVSEVMNLRRRAREKLKLPRDGAPPPSQGPTTLSGRTVKQRVPPAAPNSRRR